MYEHKAENCEQCKNGMVYVGRGEHISREQYELEKAVVQTAYAYGSTEQFPKTPANLVSKI